MASAFGGVRVLDLSQGLVGSMTAMLLGDFGARVLKVEPPPGDRTAGLAGEVGWNRNKRSLTLDIDTPDGRERLDELVRRSA
jgi:crotonobetainyl-CoA:carnitine CoA-transferase CaiB-like acyl-CoA transferase